MSVSRKDDRHNEDLVNEIADSFTRALGARKKSDEPEPERPRFVVTGDKRVPPPKNRRAR
ncbi:hypothetical protein [Amycolatopsis anabasis]|uniref:hypothetical protein n=1 Tax=Amycolatopsis anabasis TaxID=1840409 RepID=UPI00131C32E1|nr:hypothetical protein [Amycolatopsis anabasis]